MKTICHNGRVYTGGGSFAEAFMAEDGRFTAVGTNAKILPLADEETVLLDLQGRFVSPGFNDSHMHLLGFGEALGTAQLAEHTDSLAGVLACLKDFLKAHPVHPGRWLTGRGWNQDYFSDVQRMPDRFDLDTVSMEVPILATRACGHCCVINSRALEIAGITAATPAPEGGQIGKTEDGEPDGRLYDNAIELLEPFFPLPDTEELKDMIRRASKALNSYGITSVQSDDYGVFRGIPVQTVNSVFRELAESGELTVRVSEQANLPGLPGLRAFLDAGYRTGTGDERFRIGPLKLLGDGSLGSRTALLSVPYADAPETKGLSLYPADELMRMISYAHAHGMQVAVHAIGDACLDRLLDAVDAALKEHPKEDHRHGVVHCQITRADQLQRIRALGMHVYAQSVFLDYDNHIVESRVGKALAATSYSWKTLMDLGVTVSNGSDCPVELPDVMRGIECAVTRTSLDGTGPYLPEQAFTVREALDSFTVQGAYASFEEDVKGRIAPGYLADFTVLQQDPFEVPPEELHKIRVLSCFLGGEKVYGAE